MLSLTGFGKRFCRRVIRDLPQDLEAMECEDPLGVLRHHVPRLIDGITRHTGTRQPAYAHRALFGIPGSPPHSRLRSPEGNISFHFAKNVVEGRPARAFDDYAQGKGAEVVLEPDAVRAQEIEADIDRAGINGAAKHAYVRGHGGPGGGPADGWTNLKSPSDWDTIEAFERDRRVNPDGNPPGISIFYDRAPALFDGLASQPACPAGLRKVISKEQARVAAGRPLADRKARDGMRWTDERAFTTYAWIKSQPGWPKHADKDNRPARVSEGRAVQTHVAGEGEYHAALDKAARARIRAGMIDIVQRQRNVASETADGWFLPMTICDHAASGLNDPLNDHFHWLIGTRRARYTEDDELEFEQTKVHAITRDGWIDTLREELARLTNVELAAIDADVRYHPGTLEEMGIHAVAQQKMHGRRTVLERAGVSTERGLSNDAEGWRRAFAAAGQDHKAALATLDRELPPADLQHKAAREARIAATGLRHEAAQIQILIDMSRSRSVRTLQFAPEYAAEASNSRAAQGWRARCQEAECHLAALDIELTAERDDVAERLTRAEALEIEARALLAARQRQEPVRAADQSVAPPASDPQRAVDIIARAPLFIDEAEGRLFVDRRDDPDGLVAGVDLSGVQRRLVGIRASQQRELAQVQAFARRHGADALFDDACETHSAWFQSAVARWRETPVLQRYLIERERQVVTGRERDAHARDTQQHRRADRHRGVEGMADLRSLADIPFLGDLANVGGRDETVSPRKEAAPVITAAPTQPKPVVRPAASEPPAIVWSEVERRHRDYLAWRQERERQRTMEAVARVLAERVGERHEITPYAARLIRKVEGGFDPAGVPSKVGPFGLTLDQRDAGEIEVLSRDPGFKAWMDAARQRDATSVHRISGTPPATTGPNFLGRVGLVRDRLYFGPAAPDHVGPLRTALEWAEQTVALLIEQQIPLTRQDGLVGIHDPDVLRLSHHNHLGLLHPTVQHALDARFRIQTEEERGMLTKVRTGDLKVDVGIARDRLSHEVSTHVRLLGGTAEERAFFTRRQFDAAFYFRCREAAAGVPDDGSAHRSEHAALRAWLAAREDGTAQPVCDLLGQAVRKIGGDVVTPGMADADARALTQLLAPAAPAYVHGTRRRRRPGASIPLQPGRPGPSR